MAICRFRSPYVAPIKPNLPHSLHQQPSAIGKIPITDDRVHYRVGVGRKHLPVPEGKAVHRVGSQVVVKIKETANPTQLVGCKDSAITPRQWKLSAISVVADAVCGAMRVGVGDLPFQPSSRSVLKNSLQGVSFGVSGRDVGEGTGQRWILS